MIAAAATVRRKRSVDGMWRRLGRGVVCAVIATLATSSIVALAGIGLYVAGHPAILGHVFVRLIVWWRWLG